MSIIGTLLKPASDFVGDIMDRFAPTKMTQTEKATATVAIQQMITARDQVLLTTQRDIMVAELNQSDNFTKRLRPMIGYLLTLLILFNYGVRPFFGVPVVLPEQIWYVYTGLLSVYFVGRSWEKINAPKSDGGAVPTLMGLITGAK